MKKIIEINEELIVEDDLRIRKLEEELDNTFNKIEAQTDENNELTLENTRCQQRITQLQQEKKEDQKRIGQLEKELRQANKDNTERLEEQIIELDKINMNQDDITNTQREEMDRMKGKITELHTLLEPMRRRNVVQEKRIAQLKRSLSDDNRPTPPKRTKQSSSHAPENTREQETPNRKETESSSNQDEMASWTRVVKNNKQKTPPSPTQKTAARHQGTEALPPT